MCKKIFYLNLGGFASPCMGLTLLSAAFEVDLRQTAESNALKQINFKGGGQQCPPHSWPYTERVIAPDPKSVKVNLTTGSGVDIEWKDGHRYHYPFPFL